MTEDVKDQQPTELELLKQRAKQLGLKHHHNIGVDKLRDQVNAFMNKEATTATPSTPEEDRSRSDAVRAAVGTRNPNLKITLGEQVKTLSPREEAARLVRIRVSCMNPNKKDYEGDIYSVGNSKVGTFKKYVPFNNEEGWHVPNIIYKHLEERKCQMFVTQKDGEGNNVRVGKIIKEFAIEVLDPLTPDELKDLAQRQVMANGS